MIIALDTYLGKDFKPYLGDGLALYKAERMTEDNIVPDCGQGDCKCYVSGINPPMTCWEAWWKQGKGNTW